MSQSDYKDVNLPNTSALGNLYPSCFLTLAVLNSLLNITVTPEWARWRLKSPASPYIVYSTVYSGADQRKHQSSAFCFFHHFLYTGGVYVEGDRVIFIHHFTHWDRVMHICVSELTIIGSDNGLSPGRRQAIIRTNDGILLIGPLGTNFSEILIEIHTFASKKMHLKMSSGKWRPFCLGLNVF